MMAQAVGMAATSSQDHRQQQQQQHLAGMSPKDPSSRATKRHTSTSPAATPVPRSTPSFGMPSAVMTSPSLSTSEGYFGRESRTDSIGTLWSSADVPLYLDGHRGSNGDAGMNSLSSSNVQLLQSASRSGSTLQSMRGTGSLAAAASSPASGSTPHSRTMRAHSSTQQIRSQHAAFGDVDESEMLLCDEGHEFVPVRSPPRPPSRSTAGARGVKDASSSNALSGGWTITTDANATSAKNVALLQKPGSRPGSSTSSSASTSLPSTPQKHRPTRLHLAETNFDVSERKKHQPHQSQQQPFDQERPPQFTPKQSSQSTFQRSFKASDVPASISDGSQMTLTSSVRSKLQMTSDNATPRMPSSDHLYRHAEQFFGSSYSMAVPTSSALSSSNPGDVSRFSRFSDDSYNTLDDAASSLGPTDLPSMLQASDGVPHSYTASHTSLSSNESSNPSEPNESTTHLHRSGATSQKIDPQGVNTTPLRVAVSLGAASAAAAAQDVTPTPSVLNSPLTSIRRPSTTDATTASFQPKRPSVVRPDHLRHTYTTSDQEVLRRLKDGVTEHAPSKAAPLATDKLAFLNNPAPTSSSASPQKRGALFGLRIRATSTPKLRQNRVASQEGPAGMSAAAMASTSALDAAAKDLGRPTSNGRAQYPPPAPSGRFRAAVDSDELDRCNSAGSAISSQMVLSPMNDEPVSATHQQARSRRPSSSSEAWAAATRRFRRPSRAGSNNSLNGNSSLTESGSVGQRLGSSAGSHVQRELQHMSSNASLSGSHGAMSGRRSKVTTPTGTSSSRPKTKGGWATYLAHGLTLHIEQGSMKFACRMNYAYYDPFGRPESLCADESAAKGRGSISSAGGVSSSRNGSFSVGQDGEGFPDDQVMGVLEFTPESCSNVTGQSISTQASSSSEGESVSTNHLTFLASDVGVHGSPAVLKHLTIGEDTRADLITRQANLALSTAGVHEVSGSERKGTVSWRFVFAVEDVRGISGISGQDSFKILQPIRFSCSTTLLDPARARKSRVINMIRKHVGANIESHSVSLEQQGDTRHAAPSSPASYPSGPPKSDAPLSPRSLPRSQGHASRAAGEYVGTSAPLLRGARSSNASEGIRGSYAAAGDELQYQQQQHLQQQYLAGLRNGSVASVASSVTSPTWSPQPGMKAFKVKRSVAEALRGGSGRASTSEQGNAGSAVGLLATSPLAGGSSILTSPATSVDGSIPSPGKSIRELGSIASTHAGAMAIASRKQQHYARHTHGPAPATALGLETNEPGHPSGVTAPVQDEEPPRRDVTEVDWYESSTAGQWASSHSRTRARRMRAVTEQEQAMGSVVRPATASEEIKLAYLNGNSITAKEIPTAAHRRQLQAHNHIPAYGHAPAAVPQQEDRGTLAERRTTSASIYHGGPYSRQPVSSGLPGAPQHVSSHQAPSSPLREKRLPYPPSTTLAKRGPMPSSTAARNLAGVTTTGTAPRGQFDAPEGPFWM